MKLKSRVTTPPNGFIFSLPQIGIINNQSWSFGDMVKKFIDIAVANPRLNLPTDSAVVSNLLDAQNAARVAQIKGAEMYLSDDSPAPVAFTLPPTCAVCGKK
jgi:hypothetical protein